MFHNFCLMVHPPTPTLPLFLFLQYEGTERCTNSTLNRGSVQRDSVGRGGRGTNIDIGLTTEFPQKRMQ